MISGIAVDSCYFAPVKQGTFRLSHLFFLFLEVLTNHYFSKVINKSLVNPVSNFPIIIILVSENSSSLF
jgi:hypothetical protein